MAGFELSTEGFRVISYDLRSQTDSKQVGQYLGKVLEIINGALE
ncbi:MAG: hypothetical protein ACREQF_13505 [Candidatus Binataceae bacterium]